MLACGIFVTHGLVGYVAIDMTWTEYVPDSIKHHPHKTFWHYVVRTSVVLVTCEQTLNRIVLFFLESIDLHSFYSSACRRHSEFGYFYIIGWLSKFVNIGSRTSGHYWILYILQLHGWLLPNSNQFIFNPCWYCRPNYWHIHEYPGNVHVNEKKKINE